MATQKATDLRRLLADVEANERALHLRQDELEVGLIAAPAVNWPEAAGKALYLLKLTLASSNGRNSLRKFNRPRTSGTYPSDTMRSGFTQKYELP